MNLFNPHDNPVRQADWISSPLIMETRKLRLKEVVCPKDDKNSVTRQVYRPKSSDLHSSTHSNISQLRWKHLWFRISLQESFLAHLEWKHWLSAGCWVQCPRSVHWETAGWSCHNSSAYGRRCQTPAGAHQPSLSYGASGDNKGNRKGKQGLKTIFFPSFYSQTIFPTSHPLAFFILPGFALCFQILFGKHIVTSALSVPQSVLYPKTQHQKGIWMWREINFGPHSKIISKWIIT